MSVNPPPPPQWVLDLNSTPSARQKPASIPDPPGFTAPNSTTRKGNKSGASAPPARKPPTTEETDTLKLKKAWEIAIAPAKQLPMNAIGMYMTGNSLQIFSIMMVFMLFKTPLMALLPANIARTFAPFTTPGTSARLLPVKLAYVAINLLVLALGVWKVNQMGLLPTTRSDWLAWETARETNERGLLADW